MNIERKELLRQPSSSKPLRVQVTPQSSANQTNRWSAKLQRTISHPRLLRLLKTSPLITACTITTTTTITTTHLITRMLRIPRRLRHLTRRRIIRHSILTISLTTTLDITRQWVTHLFPRLINRTIVVLHWIRQTRQLTTHHQQ